MEAAATPTSDIQQSGIDNMKLSHEKEMASMKQDHQQEMDRLKGEFHKERIKAAVALTAENAADALAATKAKYDTGPSEFIFAHRTLPMSVVEEARG